LLLTGSIPAATASTLDALNPLGIVILGGTAVVSTADQTALDAWASTTRLAGGNRYATAVAISQWAYPVAGSAEVVVVATGTNFPDALAAGAVATALGGPVLLTPTDSLHPDVADEITRLDPDLIIVAGGPAAVSNDVLNQLSAIKPTVRVSGADRYATAVALSQHAFPDPDLIDIVYVAVGTNFPDALAGAAAAAATGSPVLLTPTGNLPQAVADEITRLNPTRIYILGGTAVISQAVEDQLAALLP
jgi:putative cell wall-binding protein